MKTIGPRIITDLMEGSGSFMYLTNIIVTLTLKYLIRELYSTLLSIICQCCNPLISFLYIITC
jgi:hypothetical protein